MDSQWEFALWFQEPKADALAPGGRWVQEAGDTYAYGQLMLMYGKSHHNTVK